MMNIVSSAVAAVLVCFIEAPYALARNHPDEHRDLLAAWRLKYPHLVQLYA
jgi:hypothetical protein